ncbi:MAG: P-II family nitrogen regulator [Deltaproteobacteria bacterium]|nr:P-II family nitrogen regulator [Deltaproteobacteria bacterium]
MNEIQSHDLIVTIVNRGWSDMIVKASKAAGAEGGTIVFGRGTGIHETQTLFGIPIEPEKEIVLTIVRGNKTEEVLAAIMEAGKLNKPGMGIAFVVELKKVAGICHMIEGTWVCHAS